MQSSRSTSNDDHIAHLRGLLANAAILARLPDKGEKLRVRLAKLLNENNDDDDNDEATHSGGNETAAAASSSMSSSNDKKSQTTLGGAEDQSSKKSGRSRPRIRQQQLPAEVSLSAVMHKTFDTILPRAEVARLCGEEVQPLPPQDDIDDDNNGKPAQQDATTASSPPPAAAAAAAAAAMKINKTDDAATSVSFVRRNGSSASSSTTTHLPLRAAPLKLMTWEETLRAQEQLLEEERAAELERIHRRMQLFL